jgi:uracil-DNA glycosylase
VIKPMALSLFDMQETIAPVGMPGTDSAAVIAQLASQTDFEGWRKAARTLHAAGIAPERVLWRVQAGDVLSLFEGEAQMVEQIVTQSVGKPLVLPREFIDRARTVICHRDPERFALLYRLVVRLAEDRKLLSFAPDRDVRAFEAMEKSVRRDLHKMRAFVRFRELRCEDEVRYVAWFEPQHYIEHENAPFFMRRFAGMQWSILTPNASVHWDRNALTFGAGANKSDTPAFDAAEDLWRIYFRNIFNPARLKVKAMQAEMPRKYWKNLPEAQVIDELIAGADAAATRMLAAQPTLPPAMHAGVRARHWNSEEACSKTDLPQDIHATSLHQARSAAAGCMLCPLHGHATQSVFGEGPEDARLMIVGEQPGDQEDIAGRVFVGPAGAVLDSAMLAIGLDRTTVYLTNAVKHFKYEMRGKRRLHLSPTAGEIQKCKWWLDQEIGLVRPRLAMALGSSAAIALLGKRLPIMQMRGKIFERDDGLPVLVSLHPSYVLRLGDSPEAAQARAALTADLQAARDYISTTT